MSDTKPSPKKSKINRGEQNLFRMQGLERMSTVLEALRDRDHGKNVLRSYLK
ncbi:hypothetical protein Pla22_40300 [Rubripirellula amarantea]|uniref:Uncharacterized protein n=1 Tax=Rubripirellula amarantea TaxID=2527999 RepID=A0A5C5WML9_9BACT|nr:hypothetical protein Pla22_40300 [Rubripirellula amarantea]